MQNTLKDENKMVLDFRYFSIIRDPESDSSVWHTNSEIPGAVQKLHNEILTFFF